MFIILFKSRFSIFPWPLYLNARDRISLSLVEIFSFSFLTEHLPLHSEKMYEWENFVRLAISEMWEAASSLGRRLSEWRSTVVAVFSFSSLYIPRRPPPPLLCVRHLQIPSPWIASQCPRPGLGGIHDSIDALLRRLENTLSHTLKAHSTNKICWRLNRIKML